MKDFSFIFQLTGLNVCRFYRTWELYEEGPLSSEILFHFPLADLFNRAMEKGRGAMGIMEDGEKLKFIYFSKERWTYLLGPFAGEGDDVSLTGRRYSLKNSLPVIPEEQLKAYLYALSLFRDDPKGPVSSKWGEIVLFDPLLPRAEQLSADEIDARYVQERELRSVISAGDREGLRRMTGHLTDQGWAFRYRLPHNPLRGQKNMAVVLNTIGRHAAEKGGLPPTLLHSLSDSYAMKIERARTGEELNMLLGHMLQAYCEGVYHFSMGHYSSPVARTIGHIMKHLDGNLPLGELAAVARVSPSYLSRLFHRETGKTLSAFIRGKRIEEAKRLLIRKEAPVTQIALALGYDDVNYFSRCFKQETGCTPSRYRAFEGDGDFDGLPP